MRRLEKRIAERVGQEHRVAVRVERRLGAGGDLGHQGVGDVPDDQADAEGLAAAQALREDVRLVVELLDGAHHLLAHRRTDVRMAGEHPGHGRHRDARALGDLAHARPARTREPSRLTAVPSEPDAANLGYGAKMSS